MIDFVEFPKIARLSRAIVVTEKLDGTNAQVHIRPMDDPDTGARINNLEFGIDTQVEFNGAPHLIRAGSRTRWIGVGSDNYGFANWVYQHAPELAALGPGAHFGEWWGSGIQRGYGLEKGEKRFSLFNAGRWVDLHAQFPYVPAGMLAAPLCCYVVPILYEGVFKQEAIDDALLTLASSGSAAAPGFGKPEGIIIWHEAARIYLKKTLNKDEEWKGKAAA